MHSFFMKGKRNFTVVMPAAITNICKMELKRSQNIQCVIVALSNGEIRLFKDKHLVHTLKNDVPLQPLI